MNICPVSNTRLYAHCTADRAGYPPGSVTFFFVNIDKQPSPTFQLQLGETMDIYLLTSDGSLTSPFVLLNGERLEMVDDYTLPKLTPVHGHVEDGLKLPALSLAFVVLPDAKVDICM